MANKNKNPKLKTDKKPLCKHTKEALDQYFATLNGDRPGDLYDLVIGEDLDNPEAILYQPTRIVAAPNGNIFVGDRGSNQIKMFGPDGAYLKSLGKEGQGPGEFAIIGCADPQALATGRMTK